MKDDQFRQILDHFGFSWPGYRKDRKGVMKRLSRHMQKMGARNVHEYIKALDNDPDLKLEFNRLMTVSISRFFRDLRLWEELEKDVLPRLAESRRSFVKAWCAGCASGEEPYGLKILWERVRKSNCGVPKIEILATDLNPGYLERAKWAVYPASSLKEVPEEIKSEFFEPRHNNCYSLKSFVREGIVWQVGDLLDGPPEIGFDILFLRNNLLTYYKDEAKIPALKKIISSLGDGGFLIIGSHEKIPAIFAKLTPWKKSRYIFCFGGSCTG